MGVVVGLNPKKYIDFLGTTDGMSEFKYMKKQWEKAKIKIAKAKRLISEEEDRMKCIEEDYE